MGGRKSTGVDRSAGVPRSLVSVARPHTERIATKDEVLAAIGNGPTSIINALDPDEYAGQGPNRYGRQGHISPSTNMSFLGVLDMDSNTFLEPVELRKMSDVRRGGNI